MVATPRVTLAQIVLRRHIRLGDIVFPRSATSSRIAENIDIVDIALADADPNPERFP